MIKKIVHLADVHIRTFRQHDEYMDTFKTFISQLKEEIKDFAREEVRIVIAGDLVHQKIVISNEQLLLGTWFLKRLEEIAPVILIAGNHDLLENNKDRMDSLTPMVKFLEQSNINYFKDSHCYKDDNVVWCVYSIFHENARPNIEAARAEFGDDKLYVGLFHGPLIGSSTDIGYELEHGYELEIFEGCDIVMCGDIHKKQKLIYKNIPIVFPGSLIQQNFGETVSNHGYLIWDVETKKFTEHNVANKYPFYQFRITSLEQLENGTEQATNL